MKRIPRLKKIVSAWLIVIISLSLLQACMEDPNPVGASLLPGSDLLKIDTTTTPSTTNASQKTVPNPGLPNRLLIGKSADYESWGLLRFVSIPDSLVLINVIDASVTLRASYHFGDSLAPFSMTVHRVLSSWGTDSLTIDSLKATGFYETAAQTNVSVGSIGDTATVSFPLDTSMVRTWVNAALDTVTTNFGVLLKPTNSAVIKGFESGISPTTAFRPQVMIRYSRPGLTRVDTAFVNTSIVAYAAFTSNTAWLSDSSHIFVRNGLAYRGSIGFDISNVPAGSPVHKAVLEMTLDPAASKLNSLTTDSLFAYFVSSDGVLTNSYALGEPTFVNGRKVYSFTVTNFVQFWTKNVTPRTIAIGGYTERSTFDSFVFFGSSSALKPRLLITYSPLHD
jgi:hypothetical protein